VTAEEKPKVRISRLTVDRGESKSNSGEVWKRCFYGIEFEFSSEATTKDFEDAHKVAEAKFNEWMSESFKEKPTQEKRSLNVDEIDRLLWKPYKAGHRAGWIFSNLPEAQDLAKAIRESPEQKIELGEFQYRFSGPKEDPLLFISRNPKAGPQ
jgi:hypothetical protein